MRAAAAAFTGLLPLLALCPSCSPASGGDPPGSPEEGAAPAPPARIVLSADRSHFVLEGSGARFVPWGFNYDHDRDGRLLEDYWEAQAVFWKAVAGALAGNPAVFCYDLMNEKVKRQDRG
jgi:hypothetical protein